MPAHHVRYSVDGHHLEYSVEGELAAQQARCLLLEDDDLTHGFPWAAEGFHSCQAWPLAFSKQLQDIAHNTVEQAIALTSGSRPVPDLEQYHTLVSDVEHLAVMKWLKGLPLKAQDYFPVLQLDEYLSDLLRIPVSCYNPSIGRYACNIRLIRPRRTDNNPLHKDVWLDRLRHGLNIYFPIAGSTPLSSLSLIPQSHRWPESEIQRTEGGSTVNGVYYNVPSVISSVHGLNMIRPPLGPNELLLFSPYCIHGGARNLNEDSTRISLEMRFWRKTS